MSPLISHHFQPGDRVDFPGYSGALVVHSGLGTLTLEVKLPTGTLARLPAPVSACRRHVVREAFQIGAFTLRHTEPGAVWIQTRGGEGGSFAEATLESALEKFFARHF